MIRASSFENPNLAPEYLDTLAGYDDNLYKRFVLGEFNVFEGQIYPEFNELIHVQDNVMERFVDRTIFTPIYGLDHGLHNPTAILEGWIDGQGNIYLTWEHYVPQEGIGTHATAFGGRMSESGVKNPMIAGDPSLFNKNQQPTPEKPFPFSIADLYEDYGIHITPANNSVLAGINFTKELFAQNKIMIDRSMTNLIDELNKYVWSSDRLKEHQDRPVKKHDHAVDALRYLLMTRQQ